MWIIDFCNRLSVHNKPHYSREGAGQFSKQNQESISFELHVQEKANCSIQTRAKKIYYCGNNFSMLLELLYSLVAGGPPVDEHLPFEIVTANAVKYVVYRRPIITIITRSLIIFEQNEVWSSFDMFFLFFFQSLHTSIFGAGLELYQQAIYILGNQGCAIRRCNRRIPDHGSMYVCSLTRNL